MKVIIVSPSLDSKIALGGISAVANFIVKNNHDVEYIHFEQGKRDADKGGCYRIDDLIINLKKWRSLLNNYSSAIIHYNFPLSPLAIVRDYVFMKYAMVKGRSIVVHVHGGLYMNTEKIPCFFRWILNDIFSWNIPFVVLGDKENVIIKKRYDTSNVIVLPNCVEIEETYKKTFSHVELTIGYIGRITQDKGMNELLEACKCLMKKGLYFELAIAGAEDISTHYIDSFSELLGDRFHYAGIVTGKEKAEFLKSLDVFVLPSYFEGLPMSLLECMSYGVVPIVTPVGSIPDIIRNEINGLIIKGHDFKSILDAIYLLYENKKMKEKLSQAARKTILDEYNPCLYINKLNDIYKSVLH